MVKDISIYSLQPFIDKAISFALVPLYTAYLTTGEYGTIALIMTIGKLFSPFISMGTGVAFFKFYTANKDSQGQVIFLTAMISFCLGLIVCILFLPYYMFHNTVFTSLLLLYLLSITFMTVYQKAMNLLRVMRRAGLFLVVTTLFAFARLLLNYIFIARMGLSYIGQVYAHFFVFLVIATWAILFLQRHWDCTTPKIRTVKSYLSFGFPLMISGIAGLMMSVTDKILIEFLATRGDLGLYSFASKFALLITGFMIIPVFRGIEPYIWKIYHRPDGVSIYSKLSQYMMIIILTASVLFCGLGILAAKLLTQSESYLDSLVVIPILTVAISFWGLYKYDISGLLFTSNIKTIPYVLTFTGIVNVIGNLLLIPKFGIVGASISTCISYFLLHLITQLMSHRVYPLSRMYLREYLWIVFVFVCIAIVYYLLTINLIYMAIIIPIIMVPVLLLLAMLLKLVNLTELKVIIGKILYSRKSMS